MADRKKQLEDEAQFGEYSPEREVPVEEWVQHPVSDSSDYLDGDPPAYLADEGEPAE